MVPVDRRIANCRKEETFARIIRSMPEDTVQRMKNEHFGKAVLMLCQADLSDDAVTSCLNIGFLPCMNAQTVLTQVQQALVNSNDITPIDIDLLAECCKSEQVALHGRSEE